MSSSRFSHDFKGGSSRVRALEIYYGLESVEACISSVIDGFTEGNRWLQQEEDEIVPLDSCKQFILFKLTKAEMTSCVVEGTPAATLGGRSDTSDSCFSYLVKCLLVWLCRTALL